MTKSHIEKIPQKDYVQSALRMPPELRNMLRDAATRNGRSMNAEILARLQAEPSEVILAELAELKRMVRLVIEKI